MGTQEMEVRLTSAGFGFKDCCGQHKCMKNLLLLLSLRAVCSQVNTDAMPATVFTLTSSETGIDISISVLFRCHWSGTRSAPTRSDSAIFDACKEKGGTSLSITVKGLKTRICRR